MIAMCVYICYITQNDTLKSSPFFLQQKSSQKNKQNLPTSHEHLRPSTSTSRRGRVFRRTKVAAAEIQGFEANAEHYLVVKEWSGDNGRARIPFDQGGGDSVISQKKNNRFQQKRKGDRKHGYNYKVVGIMWWFLVFFQDFFWRLVKYDHFTWEFCDLAYGIVIWATERYERLSFPKDVKHSTNMVSYKVSNLYSNYSPGKTIRWIAVKKASLRQRDKPVVKNWTAS